MKNITHIMPLWSEGLPKKECLRKHLMVCETEYAWLHDEDTTWPSITGSPISGSPKANPYRVDLVILPLRMTHGKGSILEELQCAEYCAIQTLTLWSAKIGHPVMCSSANMIVRRSTWLENYEALHPDIVSGDDMFYLEVCKRFHRDIRVIDAPEYCASIDPIPSWHDFVRQRMRWAGKAPHYRDHDIVFCGIIIVLTNILQLIVPIILLVKFPIEVHLIHAYDRTIKWRYIILLEILYPFYVITSLLGGILNQHRW